MTTKASCRDGTSRRRDLVAMTMIRVQCQDGTSRRLDLVVMPMIKVSCPDDTSRRLDLVVMTMIRVSYRPDGTNLLDLARVVTMTIKASCRPAVGDIDHATRRVLQSAIRRDRDHGATMMTMPA